jgi:GNAT superfamily N-acetyltransferase
MYVREATVDELPDVLNVVDGGLLAVDVSTVRAAIDAGDVLVAVASKPGEDERVLGTLVLDGTEVVAVAVRPRRRGQGIGTVLVETARERRGELVAEFDDRVRPFWESLGFDVDPVEGSERFRGRR